MVLGFKGHPFGTGLYNETKCIHPWRACILSSIIDTKLPCSALRRLSCICQALVMNITGKSHAQ